MKTDETLSKRARFRKSVRAKLALKKRSQTPTYQKPLVAPKAGYKWVWDPEKEQWEQVIIETSPGTVPAI